MFSVKQISLATVGTVALGLGSIAPVSAASLYEITSLSFLPSDINDSAQVVGENYLWQNGNVTDLDTLSGANNSNLFATSINNQGAIVGGGLTTSNSIGQAFVFNGSTISAVTPAFNCTSNCGYVVAEDINDSGTIALNYEGRLGLVQTSNGTTTQALSARVLFDIALNNQNQVIGGAVFTGGSSLGQFSENGQQTNLVAQAEPDSIFRLNRSTANDINDAGNIVGSGLVSTLPSNSALEATLWTTADEPGVSLGTLGGENSEAFGINNSQQVVGVSMLLDGSTQHAFLWEGDEMIDLNSLIDPALGWELTSAIEINNSGDIIGIGFYNGEQSGFVAKAVPEPSSVLGILGLGLFGLSNWRKRNK